MTTLEERIALLEDKNIELEKRVNKLEIAFSWGLYEIEQRFADEVGALIKGGSE